MSTIIVTGACGYIGSHTAIELIEAGKYEVVSIDNLINSSESTLDRIEAITGRRITNHNIDLCDKEAVREVFSKYEDITGVIHFAALKAVGESVEKPLWYYHNNLQSLINVLDCCEKFEVGAFIFSSSCSLYGNVTQLPVEETTPPSVTESPYAESKFVGERIIEDFSKTNDKMVSISLRYFNPVGAHESGLNGEMPIGRPNNLVPVITQTASGIIPKMTVFGGDYDTRDGSCIRDYIHVTDISLAHVMALDYALNGKSEKNYDVFNLGSGDGVTVKEAINTFERITGRSLNYEIGPRRPGDVVAIYSNSAKAKTLLGWETKKGIDEMMASAWKWQENWNRSNTSSEQRRRRRNGGTKGGPGKGGAGQDRIAPAGTPAPRRRAGSQLQGQAAGTRSAQGLAEGEVGQEPRAEFGKGDETVLGRKKRYHYTPCTSIYRIDTCFVSLRTEGVESLVVRMRYNRR